MNETYMNANNHECGDLLVRSTDSAIQISDGQTATKKRSAGSAQLFEVWNAGEVSLTIGYVEWAATGESDIRAIGDVAGPLALRRLERGALRMSIHGTIGDKRWVELSQARVKPGSSTKHSNLFRATWQELDEGANLDVSKELQEAGALKLGTREAVFEHGNRRRFYLCATFDQRNFMLPIVAYVCTRVLPLIHKYPAE